MKYLNIHIPFTLRSPEYLSSDPIARATWLNVLAYCAEQENGGILVGAVTWKDRQWQQICGVMLREVRAAGNLLKVEEQNIRVLFYPVEEEAIVRQKRATGRLGGKAKALAYAKASAEPNANPDGKADAEPDAAPDATADALPNAPTKGNEKKGKENIAERERARELPTWESVKALAAQVGLAEWKALDWFNEMEGGGWLDHLHRPIAKWQAVLIRVKTKWEADGRPENLKGNSHGKNSERGGRGSVAASHDPSGAVADQYQR